MLHHHTQMVVGMQICQKMVTAESTRAVIISKVYCHVRGQARKPRRDNVASTNDEGIEYPVRPILPHFLPHHIGRLDVPNDVREISHPGRSSKLNRIDLRRRGRESEVDCIVFDSEICSSLRSTDRNFQAKNYLPNTLTQHAVRPAKKAPVALSVLIVMLMEGQVKCHGGRILHRHPRAIVVPSLWNELPCLGQDDQRLDSAQPRHILEALFVFGRQGQPFSHFDRSFHIPSSTGENAFKNQGQYGIPDRSPLLIELRHVQHGHVRVNIFEIVSEIIHGSVL